MDTPVVVAGSADGLERVTKALGALAPGAGISLVIVQRLLGGADHLLAKTLHGRLALPVSLATDGTVCFPDRVWVAPARAHVEFEADTPPRLRITTAGRASAAPSLDRALFSAAAQFGTASRAILCFGPRPAEDGYAGCREILRVGGRVCVADVMPAEEAALAFDVASHPREVVPPHALPRLLQGGSGADPNDRSTRSDLAVPRHRVLIVDDEAIALSVPQRLAERLGWEIETAPNGVDALERLRAHDYDLLLTDIRMPGMDGVDLAREARALCPAMPIIVVSGFPDDDAAEALRSLGITAFLRKPYRVSELRALFDKVVADV